ncbi:UDP-N-acetylglucosamine--N-acetylmuramyl-(pentapeptide) pyrophosphoryl-undecaprenol N-acetylglucosamine transferase [Nocardioides dokdonensis FR1436]|uniref:UDP-N-acetylglucosamine--N-acetylmuramyl-(pentapeptide) pyrophosphoryl-undecaprenol N-acetylglucosamine transferase n=1 Tax=Nocardioides dokdonensis FR1436 TaxID=1300347 RepID=A0A1A9GLH6_9ACTN|nr:undecaprenyldiphospho-muramoylpentapeptide beta-N-acetylglucosaminyltransferase [Nocardioides dokdonensis]ANH39149.1 UDP-N-acetylglucosamine--N-acetylmuramyl-(pentapeptide) pyrophosphoryl-undecaprenol N-acetylglucosamine transferase [Nocardioides dokdonensis FR1436]
MRILLAGGGTAGHTSPLLATADALRRLDPTVEITCLGTPRGLENTVVPAAGYPLELVPPVPLPRKPGLDLLRVPGRIRRAVRETHAVLDRVDPDVVVGYGGYVSVPAYLAARKRRLPVVVHEQNALPGLGNKLGARVAARRGGRVAVSFPDTPLPGAEYVGLPIRRMISTLDRDALRAEARAFFGLDPDRPTLVVTGGSQGARRLNQAVSGAVRQLGAAGVQVLHVIGPKGEIDPGAATATGTPYVVEHFVDRMDYALAAADLMVCRSGANSVVEAAATGVPAVFVPLPIGNGEQELNARPVVDAGGALLVRDEELTTGWVVEHVVPLVTDAARLATMSAAARHLVPRDADETLARIVLEAGGARR